MNKFKLTDAEWAWIAGLIEGEGCIGIYQDTPTFVIQMTDEDVIARRATYLDANYRKCPGMKEHYKPLYRITLKKRRTLEIIFINTMPWLGQRRASKVSDCYTQWMINDAMKLKKSNDCNKRIHERFNASKS